MTTITAKHTLLLNALADFGAQFTVVAGKYDGDGENCKYSDRFVTYDEALTALDKVRDYPWSRVEVMHPELSELRMEKLRAAPTARPEPVAFGDYPEYVAACRAHARATRQRVVSYANPEQFRAAHGAQA